MDYKQITADAYKYHTHTLAALGVSTDPKNRDFVIKKYGTYQNEITFWLYENEVKKDKLIIELVDENGTPYSGERKLYVYKKLADPYTGRKSNTFNDNKSYAFKLSELTEAVIEYNEPAPWDNEEIETPADEFLKKKFERMNLGEFAAIVWKQPVSDNKELNNMINNLFN